MAWILGTFSLLAFLYLLYINGYAAHQKKAAVMFIGRRRGKEARFSQCHGAVCRVLSVKETKSYHFVLNADITQGRLEINILDKN